MKIILLLFILISLNLFSQPKSINYSNWLFGKGAGITFNTNDGNAKEILDNIPELETEEGISTYSDDDGFLKLSCSGLVLSHFYDKTDYSKYKIFDLGDYIQTGSSTNSNIIVPSLENKDQFYIFFANDNVKNYKFVYRIFDVSLDNGKGDWIQDFEELYDFTIAEKITAIYDYDYNFYWIVVGETLPYNGFHILLYKLDENGLQKVPKKFDLVIDRDLFGSIKFSPDGKYLAYCSSRGYRLLIYKFNFEDGTLSEFIDYKEDKYSFYSVDFSPNSTKVYVSARNENINRTELFQFDLRTTSNDDFIFSRKMLLEFETEKEFRSVVTFKNKTYVTTNKTNYDLNDYNNLTNNLTIIDNPNEDFENLKFNALNFSNSRYPIHGLNTIPTILNEPTIQYDISKPDIACFGDSFELSIKSIYNIDYIAEVVRVFPTEQIIGIFNSLDSTISFKDSNDYNSNFANLIAYEARLKYSNNIFDTVKVSVNFRLCCDNTVKNGNFQSNSTFDNINGYCKPIDYFTDFDFRESSNSSCPKLFTDFGQIASTSNAGLHHSNFQRTPHKLSHLLVGDPLPNVPQRAWYQVNPTRRGTRYKFTAFVCNVEKTPRYIGEPRQLNIWLGIRNRNQDLVLKRIDDIKYEDDWIELSDEFIADDNSTELAIWVLGESKGNMPSYGFGIDDISLIPLPDYSLDADKDTIICETESVQLNNKFEGDITSIEWIPTIGLDDPTSLNPIASPTESTTYTLKVKDKYFCEYQETIVVNIDPCLNLCTPDLSVYLNDKVVQLGDTFCINGTFIPECADDSFLDKLNIYFEYDPFLMSFLSTSSSTYSIIQNKEKSILKLTFDSKDLLVNQANEFSFCFRSLLGDSKYPVINVLDNDESKISYSLIDSINSNIEYISCDQPFRQIKWVIVTDFEAILVNRNLSIRLATEEEGLFKFIIVDVNGQIVKQQDYNTSKSKYSYEEIFQIDLSDISSGVYNIRMTSPSGKYYTKRIILVD
jgi:hypothetical protein